MPIREMVEDVLWMKSAACASVGTEAFFPDKGLEMFSEIAQAKAVCLRCPVREACLSYSLERNVEYGVWGGYTRNERLAIKRRDRLRLVARAS